MATEKHEDTSVSLDPLTFAEAIQALAGSEPKKRIKRKGSPAEESGNTTPPDPAPDPEDPQI